jgi:hypothetical protein
MDQLLSQCQGFLTTLYGLCRVAQTPQSEGRIDKARHSRRLAMVEHQGRPRRWVSESNPLFEVRPGGAILAHVEQGAPEHCVSFQAERRCGLALRQPVELFPQRLCC